MFSVRVPSTFRVVGAFGFAFVLSASVFLGSPQSIAARSGDLGSWGGWLSMAATAAAPFRPLIDALAHTNGLSTGTDGRLTVLLLGSDTRKGGVGRTDTIMIMSIKGNTISAASIPRDTARIPNPFTPSTSDTFSPRVNAILKSLVRSSGGNIAAGMDKFDQVIESTLQIEIDYHALITFKGFDQLVDVVDPIYVNNTQNIKDPKFWDDPDLPKGVYFPPSSSYQLNALPLGPLCNGLWKTAANPATYACHRALPFVRSRKGPSNSDFQRAHRQQNFVAAVIDQIMSGELYPLVTQANTQVAAHALYTNIPITTTTASDLYIQLHLASLSSSDQVVFAPSTYSTHIPGTTAYVLKLPAVRAWTAVHMR